MADRDELLKKSWVGEILGRSVFETLVEVIPADVRMWELLAALERTTADVIEPVGRADGMEVDKTALARAGAELARAASEAGWGGRNVLTGGLTIVAECRAIYEKLGSLLAEDEAWLADELVAHKGVLAHS